MILFYFLVLMFFLMVAYDGYDSTIRLVFYLDILYRHTIVKIQMFLLKKQIQYQNFKDHKSMNKAMENKK